MVTDRHFGFQNDRPGKACLPYPGSKHYINLILVSEPAFLGPKNAILKKKEMICPGRNFEFREKKYVIGLIYWRQENWNVHFLNSSYVIVSGTLIIA